MKIRMGLYVMFLIVLSGCFSNDNSTKVTSPAANNSSPKTEWRLEDQPRMWVDWARLEECVRVRYPYTSYSTEYDYFTSDTGRVHMFPVGDKAHKNPCKVIPLNKSNTKDFWEYDEYDQGRAKSSIYEEEGYDVELVYVEFLILAIEIRCPTKESGDKLEGASVKAEYIDLIIETKER